MNIAYRFPCDMLTTVFQKAIVTEDQNPGWNGDICTWLCWLNWWVNQQHTLGTRYYAYKIKV